MKLLKIFLTLVLGCVALVSCSEEETEEIPGKEYSDTVNLPDTGGKETYVLEMFDSEIVNGAISTPEWLTLNVQAYQSGSPSIKISAKANTENVERKFTMVFFSKKNDKLKLTIIQSAKKKIPSEIDDVHNNTSSKPAYSGSRR